MKRERKMGRNASLNHERETRVLLEEVRHEVKTIAEGHAMLSARIDRLESRLTVIEQELHTIKNILFDINNTLKDFGCRIVKLEDKVYH